MSKDTKPTDYAEAQLTPEEAKLAKMGVHIVRCNADDDRSKVKQVITMLAAVLGDNSFPSDEKLEKLLDEQFIQVNQKPN